MFPCEMTKDGKLHYVTVPEKCLLEQKTILQQQLKQVLCTSVPLLSALPSWGLQPHTALWPAMSTAAANNGPILCNRKTTYTPKW